MPNVINPHIAVIIRGETRDDDWFSDDENPRLEMEIEITKDLDDEPNEAEVTIYNLNEDTRARIVDPSIMDQPITIHFAPFGSDELTKCFIGEIETARTVRQWPGLATKLVCRSQRWQTRSKYLDGVTYEAGTSVQQIVDDMTAVIDLPVQSEPLSSDSILIGQTFTGPAFLALKKFLLAHGAYTYIVDGVLYISDVYNPPNPTVAHVTRAMMVSEPTQTQRKDVVDVVLQSQLEANPNRKRRDARSKRTRSKNALGRNGYISYDAVDDIVYGIECETLGTPEINPDNIVTFEGLDNQYRVQEVTHQGDTREGVTTFIKADVYPGSTIYGGAF